MLGVVGAFFRWAHPRSRGENWPHRRGGATTGGSSPLTRGKPRVGEDSRDLARLIPAHAGKTSGRLLRAVLGRAHPRSRGENARANGPACPRRGSSPLTRGKLGGDKLVGVLSRLIPAHAGKTYERKTGQPITAAHPRSRGENRRRYPDSCRPQGSSPLTRGKRRCRGGNRGHERLIPAHAGKTVAKSAKRWPDPAHPRSRGENFTRPRPASVVCGSSPLTRGKLDDVQRGPVGPRLIPAHAGKTPTAGDPAAWHAAHPRSRGENGPAAGMVPRVVGSSPLTRGKQTNAALAGPPGRLIPAHAGKTWSYVTGPDNLWAHPRSRGENAFRRRKRQHTRGSSPLTRGKRPRAQPLHASQRLIPAHAGKTPRRHRVAASLPAHPRSRGENGRCSLSFSLLRGSSPLTRGKRGLVVACEVGARLIPAHAGKTPYGTTPHLQSGAHPRSRGENFVVVEELPDGVGSSPLTRGKQRLRLSLLSPPRLIPAHAGKTAARAGRRPL